MTDTAPRRPSQSRTAKLARARLARLLEGLGTDDRLWAEVQERVPEAWATLEEDVDVEEPKVKVTLMLDQSVAKVFRSMGKGWQARVNRILATYVQMKIGEVEREAAEMSRLIVEHGVPVPDELVMLYRENPELFDGLGAKERAFLKRLMGE